jgi:hypothetical protein
LYFGVPAGSGVDEGASLPCEVGTAPEEVVLDPAAGAVLVPPADAVGVAAVDRFVAVLRFAGKAVDLPRFSACDELTLGVLDVVGPREEELVVIAVFVGEPFVVVAELCGFAADLWVFVAELLVFGAALVVLVVAGLVVAAGAAAAGPLVAVLVVLVLVVLVPEVGGAVLTELVVVEFDGDPACCWATQVS